MGESRTESVEVTPTHTWESQDTDTLIPGNWGAKNRVGGGGDRGQQRRRRGVTGGGHHLEIV